MEAYNVHDGVSNAIFLENERRKLKLMYEIFSLRPGFKLFFKELRKINIESTGNGSYFAQQISY